MLYTPAEVMDYVEQEDVKFIRLAFFDVFGRQKNISVMPSELYRAFEYGCSFDSSAIDGFHGDVNSDLLLIPDPSTLEVLPWRPSHGRVIRLFCDIKNPDGRSFEADSRHILKKAQKSAEALGLTCYFGAEYEFYLFKADENGEPTQIPHDNASYMDIAPEDRGENIRREICLTIEEMGLLPESSHHEEGPGQHEINFKFSEGLVAADNAATFKSAVKTISSANGLYACFEPKPLEQNCGNGFHINISVKSNDGIDHTPSFIAGILEHIREITLFLNPSRNSYKRLGEMKAPKFIAWSPQNRTALIRIPAAKDIHKRFELRSPDPLANPHLAYSLLMYAGIDGIKKNLSLPEAADLNLYTASPEQLQKYNTLPQSLEEAIEEALNSDFVKSVLPQKIIKAYTEIK